MKNSWFHRMIWSYIPIFLIICSFIFFIFFNMLSEQQRKNAISANRVSTSQILQTVDVSLKSIDTTVVNDLMNEPIYEEFFYQTGLHDVALHYRVSKQLKLLTQQLPMVESIDLVRFEDELIFNGNLIHPIRKSEDREFIGALKEGVRLTKWTGLRKYKHYPFQDDKEVLSLVYPYPLNIGGQGGFIVNVRASALERMLEDITGSTNVFVTVRDAEGNRLFGSADDGGQRGPVMSKMTSGYTGWTIDSGLVDGTILQATSLLSDVWMVVGLFVFGLGIVSIVYVTRRNYRPLKELIAKIDTYLHKETESLGDMRSDEFFVLQSTIDRYIAKSEHIEKQIEETAELKKKSFFGELLNGWRDIDPDRLHQELEKHGLDPGGERLSVFVAEIDRYDEVFQKYKERDRYLFKFIVHSVTREIMGTDPFRVWVEWIAEDRIAGIVFADRPDADVKEAFDRLCRWVEGNLKFTVTAGLGLEKAGWAEVAHSYKEAVQALQYKAVLGSDRWIAYADVLERRTTDRGDSLEAVALIHDFAESYRLDDPEWENKLALFFADARSRLRTKDDLLILVHYFIYYLDLQITQLPKEYGQLWKGKALPGLLDAAKRLDTWARMEADLTDILHDFRAHTLRLREEKSHCALLKEIRTYVEEHYANPDLSLDYLSDRFEINSKYLSHLFKEQFGENFIDFLTRKRVEEAKRMLLEASHSIQEVGDKVGYPNATTFRRAFKKVVGFSPVDFRRHGEPS
ncbi:helix-turn-helix domain-containing protein [Paenibacillus sp.]|uniref:helix-turn-helix domain-containing protein n=1 Tax=Paenibacillus sp. TaxID=58172 RepID=UPI0028126D7E|nr:helix-turn-helix domain-containing protein [Paenibacillus sp.]